MNLHEQIITDYLTTWQHSAEVFGPFHSKTPVKLDFSDLIGQNPEGLKVYEAPGVFNAFLFASENTIS